MSDDAGAGGGVLAVDPVAILAVAAKAAAAATALDPLSGLASDTLWPAAVATSQGDLQSALIEAMGRWQTALAARAQAVSTSAAQLYQTAESYTQTDSDAAGSLGRLRRAE